MNRINAREAAVHLLYAASYETESVGTLLEYWFCIDNLQSLCSEDELSDIYEKTPDDTQLAYISRVARGVEEHMPEIDSYIEKYSIGWNFGRLPRVAVAIMRVAMYEVLYMPEIPDAAAINAAVELCKHYYDKEITAFVNGILGSYSRTEPL